MPQFDIVTFFNQIFWLIFLFFSFYILLLRFFLPKISSILKTRNKKLLYSSFALSDLKTEHHFVLDSSFNFFCRTSAICNTFFLKDLFLSNSWISFNSFLVKNTIFQNTQNAYFKCFNLFSAKKLLF